MPGEEGRKCNWKKETRVGWNILLTRSQAGTAQCWGVAPSLLAGWDGIPMLIEWANTWLKSSLLY